MGGCLQICGSGARYDDGGQLTQYSTLRLTTLGGAWLRCNNVLTRLRSLQQLAIHNILDSVQPQFHRSTHDSNRFTWFQLLSVWLISWLVTMYQPGKDEINLVIAHCESLLQLCH